MTGVKGLRAALALFALLTAGAASAAAGGSGLPGPAFSDPAAGQPMPPEWEASPVKHGAGYEGADLVVNLNQQFYEFMVDDIDAFARQNNLTIKVLRGTCGITAGMLQKKEADVGAFCCPPGRGDRLPGLRFHTVGIHPISVLVHPENPTENISFDEVRDVFQGKTARWSRLGWKDRPIQVVARLHCKKRPGHWRLMLGEADLFGAEAKEVGAIEDMFSLVASTPTAIGFEVMWMSSRLEGKVKTLKIDGHDPADLEFLLRAEYPLYRVLVLTTWEADHTRNAAADRLVKYVVDRVEEQGGAEGIIPVSRLRSAGWKFEGDELVGEPDRRP